MNPSKPPFREVSGKLIIVTVLILGVVAAAFAWGFRRSRTKQVLAFWGGENAAMIRDRNSDFELFLIEPDPLMTTNVQNPLLIDGQSFVLLQGTKLRDARGALHMRESLLNDLNFQWEEKRDDASQPDWRYLLRFADDDDHSIMAALDLTSGRLIYVEENSEVFLSPKMTVGWRSFIEEQLGEEAEIDEEGEVGEEAEIEP